MSLHFEVIHRFVIANMVIHTEPARIDDLVIDVKHMASKMDTGGISRGLILRLI